MSVGGGGVGVDAGGRRHRTGAITGPIDIAITGHIITGHIMHMPIGRPHITRTPIGVRLLITHTPIGGHPLITRMPIPGLPITGPTGGDGGTGAGGGNGRRI